MTIEEVRELKKDIDMGGWAEEEDVLELIKLVEQFEKEKEWLLNRTTGFYRYGYGQVRIKELNEEMQQALEE